MQSYNRKGLYLNGWGRVAIVRRKPCTHPCITVRINNINVCIKALTDIKFFRIHTETVWDKENGDVRQYVYCIASKAIKLISCTLVDHDKTKHILCILVLSISFPLFWSVDIFTRDHFKNFVLFITCTLERIEVCIPQETWLRVGLPCQPKILYVLLQSLGFSVVTLQCHRDLSLLIYVIICLIMDFIFTYARIIWPEHGNNCSIVQRLFLLVFCHH